MLGLLLYWTNHEWGPISRAFPITLWLLETDVLHYCVTMNLFYFGLDAYITVSESRESYAPVIMAFMYNQLVNSALFICIFGLRYNLWAIACLQRPPRQLNSRLRHDWFLRQNPSWVQCWTPQPSVRQKQKKQKEERKEKEGEGKKDGLENESIKRRSKMKEYIYIPNKI